VVVEVAARRSVGAAESGVGCAESAAEPCGRFSGRSEFVFMT
jgi:hypothetical protein